jgi:hypothetical protein
MPSKVTYIFNVATQPGDLAVANIHTAGWSESYWQPALIPATFPAINALATKRALLLPSTASIVGVRVAQFTISGNRLLPQGASTSSVRFPGNSAFVTDLPQVSLQCSGRSIAGANTSRFVLRCIPDVMMEGGEYKPTPAFSTALTNFFNLLKGGNGWSFLGRVIANPTFRVDSIAANVLVSGITLNIDDYVRFLRVINSQGDAVTGAFRVTAIGGPPVGYTLAGLPAGTSVTGSGLCRLDEIALFNFSDVTFKRAGVRKVGRPSESYRGRASRRR